MQEIPVNYMDQDVRIIYVDGNDNNLTVGPIFTKFNYLNELRLIESNIPSLGYHSFRGMIYLRILGK